MSITKEKTKHLHDLYFELQLWVKELGFYKDELAIFNRRLKEVGDMYTNREVLARLEHFQNQFIVQDEVSDILLHDVREHNSLLVNAAKDSVIAIDHRAFADHPLLRDRMDSFIKIYRELRNEYMIFLSEVM